MAFSRAGALANEKTMTSEGIELTFASHLLFGPSLKSGCLGFRGFRGFIVFIVFIGFMGFIGFARFRV